MHRSHMKDAKLSNKLLAASSLWVVTEPDHKPYKELCVGDDPFRLAPRPGDESSPLPTPPHKPREGDTKFHSRVIKLDNPKGRGGVDFGADFEIELDAVLRTHDMSAVLEWASDIGPIPEPPSLVPGAPSGDMPQLLHSPAPRINDSDDESDGTTESDASTVFDDLDEPPVVDRMDAKTPIDLPSELPLPDMQRHEMKEADIAMRALAEEAQETFPLKRTLRAHWYTKPSTWRVEEPLHVLLQSARRDMVLGGPKKGLLRTAEGGVLPLGRQKLELCPEELDSDDVHGIMLEKQLLATDIAKSFKAHLEANHAHVPHFLQMCKNEANPGESPRTFQAGETPRGRPKPSPRKHVHAQLPAIGSPRLRTNSKAKGQTPRHSPRLMKVLD